ncbi:hypothetical protein [Chitinibacter tainanensis]|uniref:hypothetical protein n=1 Tax=Chitinibacter tainanensis TaxID=230667 RepID=UPI0023553B01|nr:hypothetical protein [Chitinibacter tainanensis]
MKNYCRKSKYKKDASSFIYHPIFRAFALTLALFTPFLALIEAWISGLFFQSSSLAYTQKISYALLFTVFPAMLLLLACFERFYNILHLPYLFDIEEHVNTKKKFLDLWWSHFSETTRIFLFMAISASVAAVIRPSPWWGVIWIGVTLTIASLLCIVFCIKYGYGFVSIANALGEELNLSKIQQGMLVIFTTLSLMFINALAFWAVGSISIIKIAQHYSQ